MKVENPISSRPSLISKAKAILQPQKVKVFEPLPIIKKPDEQLKIVTPILPPIQIIEKKQMTQLPLIIEKKQVSPRPSIEKKKNIEKIEKKVIKIKNEAE